MTTDDSELSSSEEPADESAETDFRIDGVAEDSTTITTELIDRPSVSLWKLELQYLITGERGEQLFRAGDAGAYIQTLWAEMEAETVGRASFHEAFNEFVQEWTPWSGESPTALNIMLSLLSAFTPPAGFIKLAGYLTLASWSHLSAIPHTGTGPEIDLHLKALVTLRNYHRVAPLDESGSAFKTYLRILRFHLTRPKYFGFAASQLLALDQIETDDARFADGIRQWPESLREIVPPLLSPYHQDTAARDLGRIYTYCLPMGSPAFTIFEEVITARGGVISRDHQPRVVYLDGHVDDFWEPEPIILLADGSRIEINLSTEQMVNYVEAREPTALPPIRSELIVNQGKQVADFVRLVEGYIIHYIDTHSRGGHEISWTPLREELRLRGVELIINRNMGLGYIYFIKTHQTVALQLPRQKFEILLGLYFSPQHITPAELLAKTETRTA